MKFLALACIRLYQKTISPDHGILHFLFPNGYCRFRPSCSQYGHDSIKKHGLMKGSALSAKRLLRCNPFSQGGEDAVP